MTDSTPMSAPLPEQRFGITAHNLRVYDWQSVLETADQRDCIVYYELFGAKGKSLADAGDQLGAKIFTFLTVIASFCPKFDSPTQRYAPLWEDYKTGKRTLTPEDLTNEDLDALAGVVTEIRDAEFRARVADVLWESRKDYKAAQTAVDAYIESSRRSSGGDVWWPVERLQRAMQLGAKLGRLKQYHHKVIDEVAVTIDRHESNEKGLLCARLMGFLFAEKVGDPKKYGPLAEQLAKRAEGVADWPSAREYWSLKAAWDHRDGKTEDARAAELLVANTYGQQARRLTQGDQASFGSAAYWMAKYVHALREAKAPPKDIEAAHQTLLDYQRRSTQEMEHIQIPLDEIPGLEDKFKQAAEQSIAQVRGHSFEDAILRLAFWPQPTDPEDVKKRIQDPNPDAVFGQLFGSTTVRSDGQTSDTRPAIGSPDPKDREEAVLKEMYYQARIADWPFRAEVLIEPARQQIVAEHPARLRDLAFLVRSNPFVPNGREGLFLRGLHAGLHGDLVIAMHLLLPQIENSIREIFIAKGIITSKLESDQTQDERDLGWLLTHAEMANTFGKGTAFDLRGLLVERFGLNIRNAMAHGFLTESEIVTPGALYVWWLVLRLCCIPPA